MLQKTEQEEIQDGCFFLSLYQQPLRCAKNLKFVQQMHSSLTHSFFLSFLPSLQSKLSCSDWSTGYGAVLLFFFLSRLTFPLLSPFLLRKEHSLLFFWASVKCLWFTCVCSAGFWSVHPFSKSVLTAESSLCSALCVSPGL